MSISEGEDRYKKIIGFKKSFSFKNHHTGKLIIVLVHH